jgi:antitoxin StbD
MTGYACKWKCMLNALLADSGVSISTLKKNPLAVIEAAGGFPIAVLNRNTPAAYLVPAAAWEALMERLDDIELAEIVSNRAEEIGIPVNIDDL